MGHTDFILRDYHDGDFPGIENLWNSTGVGGSERGDDDLVIQKTIEQGGKLIVMEERGNSRIIGTSWITNDGRRLYLHHFAILPDFQRKGLSKPLLDASMEFARDLKMQIKLEVHRSNRAAERIYIKGGFSYLGDYLVYIIRDPSKKSNEIKVQKRQDDRK